MFDVKYDNDQDEDLHYKDYKNIVQKPKTDESIDTKKKHRGTIDLGTEHDNNTKPHIESNESKDDSEPEPKPTPNASTPNTELSPHLTAEESIAKDLEIQYQHSRTGSIVFGDTKPGLFSDEDDDDYVKIGEIDGSRTMIQKQSPSHSSEMDQSFGDLVINHPLTTPGFKSIMSTDDEQLDINGILAPLGGPGAGAAASSPLISFDDTGIDDSGQKRQSYKKARKAQQRPSTMTHFTPSYLRGIHDVPEIGEHENKALWKQIMKDVNRTFQYRDFFRKKETRHSLGNLLYIWSRINHKVGYLQGMHDLASIITCAIFFDYKIKNNAEDDSSCGLNDDEMSVTLYLWASARVLSVFSINLRQFLFLFLHKSQDNAILEDLLDPKYLEHDVYAVYSALLGLIVKFFEQAVPPQKEDEDSDGDEVKDENGNVTRHYNRGLFDSGSNCSLYLKLHYLQHKLLKHFDLNLYTHFENLGLSPQLYMLRWIRVLFSREFFLDQIIQLWDELFVSENLIEFIDYIVMAMIHNVRKELLQKKDMTIIAILQNYPKEKIDIESLAMTARYIQNGQIKPFEFISDNKELYSEIKSSAKMRDYSQESIYLFNEIKDYSTLPTPNTNINSNDQDPDFYDYIKGPDIRIPGFGDITPTQKYLVKKIILSSYGTTIKLKNGYIRQGYLVKRGSGDQSFFARKNLKIRWFVINEQKKMSYYKNKKSFEKREEPLRPPIKLKGRAVRVVESKHFCFEISGINVSKRAYLLFAKDFSDFVLWLHALMWCADKSLYEVY